MRRNIFVLAGLTGLLAASTLVVSSIGSATAAESDCEKGTACTWSEKNYEGTLTSYTEGDKGKCINQAFTSVKNNFAQDSQISVLTYQEPDCLEDNKGAGGDQLPPGGFGRASRPSKSLKLQHNPDGSSSSGEAGGGGKQQNPIDALIGQLPR